MVSNGAFASALVSKPCHIRRKISADVISADEFVSSFNDLTNGYSIDQIFNCDETGLYCNIYTSWMQLTTTHNDPSGTIKAKERVTINACSNTSGSTKLPLLFIVKAKNPCCFHGIDKSTLPVMLGLLHSYSVIGFKIALYLMPRKN